MYNRLDSMVIVIITAIGVLVSLLLLGVGIDPTGLMMT